MNAFVKLGLQGPSNQLLFHQRMHLVRLFEDLQMLLSYFFIIQKSLMLWLLLRTSTCVPSTEARHSFPVARSNQKSFPAFGAKAKAPQQHISWAAATERAENMLDSWGLILAGHPNMFSQRSPRKALAHKCLGGLAFWGGSKGQKSNSTGQVLEPWVWERNVLKAA